MILCEIAPERDAALAALIRRILSAHGLDIPGTAYFDSALDHLSRYYLADPAHRAYFTLLEEDGALLGGVGIAAFEPMPGWAELQKLYLDERVRGRGLGRRLLEAAEDAARARGYRRMYLETHTHLQAALRLYERAGYVSIDRPEAVVHSTMDRFYLKSL